MSRKAPIRAFLQRYKAKQYLIIRSALCF